MMSSWYELGVTEFAYCVILGTPPTKKLPWSQIRSGPVRCLFSVGYTVADAVAANETTTAADKIEMLFLMSRSRRIQALLGVVPLQTGHISLARSPVLWNRPESMKLVRLASTVYRHHVSRCRTHPARQCAPDSPSLPPGDVLARRVSTTSPCGRAGAIGS